MGSPAACAFLEKLQIATYSRLGIQPQVYGRAWFDNIRSKLADQHEMAAVFNQVFSDEPTADKRWLLSGWKRGVQSLGKNPGWDNIQAVLDKLPTEYENPAHYTIMLNLQSEVEHSLSIMRNSNWDVSDTPPITIGTLPTGEVNARAIKVPTGRDILLIFDSQLFDFINLLSKAVAIACSPTKLGGKSVVSLRPEDIRRGIKQKPEVAGRFKDVITKYFVLGLPQAAAPYTLDPELQPFANLLVKATELFIMAHEYGHIQNGDLAPSVAKRRNTIGTVEVNEYMRDWEREFSADKFAAEVVSPTLQIQGVHPMQSYIGADFFFLCAMLMERGINILTNGIDLPLGLAEDDKTASHPPAGMRMVMIERAMKRGFPPEMLNGIVAARDLLAGAIEVLWAEIAAPELMRLHRSGVRPEKRWLEVARQHFPPQSQVPGIQDYGSD